VIEKSFHDGSKDAFGNFSANLDAVVTILKNFGFDDWHETVVLANGAISSKWVCCLCDSKIGRKTSADLNNSAPFGKTTSFFIESFCTASKTVKASSGILTVGASNNDKALIKLYTNMDASLSQELSEVLAICGSLVDCLFKHDDSADVLLNAWGSEK